MESVELPSIPEPDFLKKLQGTWLSNLCNHQSLLLGLRLQYYESTGNLQSHACLVQRARRKCTRIRTKRSGRRRICRSFSRNRRTMLPCNSHIIPSCNFGELLGHLLEVLLSLTVQAQEGDS